MQAERAPENESLAGHAQQPVHAMIHPGIVLLKYKLAWRNGCCLRWGSRPDQICGLEEGHLSEEVIL